jgi:hypothetical protein
MMQNIIKITLAAILFSLTFVSCELLKSDEPVSEAKGRIAIMITDAPFPADLVEHVYVTVKSVSLRNEEGKCGESGEEESEYPCESGYLLLLDEPVVVDLLVLRNGLTDLLVDASIPVGKYDMISLQVEDARIVIEPGVEYDLKVLGGSASGIKLKFKDPVEVTEDGLTEILVDFDLSKSFTVQGNPKNKAGIKGFIFKPAIRVVDLSKSGSISGKVTGDNNTPLVNAGITLYSGNDPIATAVTGEEGEYVLPGIHPGTYKLEAEAEGYKTAESTVTVTGKKQNTVKNIRLSRP